MTLKHYYDGVLVATSVQLSAEKGIAAAADLFSPEMFPIIVDDPALSLTFLPFKSWRIVEDAAPSGNQTVWYGFVGRQVIKRTGSEGDLFPTGRAWHLTLIEAQTLAARRLLRESEGANRPADETVSDRLDWLLTTAGFAGIIADHGNVAASAVTLEESPWVNRYGTDLLQELAMRAGFNAYARYREASSDLELFFYDTLVSHRDAATIALSNDPAEVDGSTTFPVFIDSEWEGMPERIASTVAVPTADTTIYATDAATASAYAEIDQVAPDGDVQDATKAQALADHLLHQHSTQEEELRLTTQLPAAQVNDVLPGQLISVQLTHVPGYTTGKFCRVRRRVVSRPPNLTQARYDVGLTLYPLLATVYSEAQLQSPGDANYVDGSLFAVDWAHDGDDPQGGCSGIPLSGLMTYNGTAGARAGIVMGGAGIVDIHTHGTISGSTAGGDHTFDVYVYNGATVIGHQTHTDVDPMTGGDPDARALSWTWDLDVADVEVREGDVISVKFAVSPEPAIFVIPAGVGDCLNMLLISGELVRR